MPSIPSLSTLLMSVPWLLAAASCTMALLWADGGPTHWRFILPTIALGPIVLLHRRLPDATLPALVLLFLGIAGWFASLTPSHDRAWNLEQSRMPHVDVDAEGFTVHDHRSFRWRDRDTPEPAWTTERFAWDDLQGADLGISRFSDFRPMAHTFVSLRFAGGRVLVVSVEVRKEKGEAFNPLRGLFRSYERMVVLGDERDLVALRAIHLEEQVELLPLQVDTVQIEAFLRAVIDETNRLHDKAAWYHTMTASCSTSLASQLRTMDAMPWDVRILFPGLLDELAWELGWLGERPLPELLEAHRIDVRARAIGDDDPAFSTAIRTP